MGTYDQETDRRIGAALRAERKRLGLSTSTVAHHCKTSTVTIWSWETGKAKIPMRCLVSLVPLGFDPETIIPREKSPKISLDKIDRTGQAGKIAIERHRLARLVPAIHEQVSWRGYAVYHNLEWLDDLTDPAPGSLCLVDKLLLRHQEDEPKPSIGIFLLRHPVSGIHSLASAKIGRDDLIRFAAGSASLEVPLAEDGKRSGIVGEVLGSVGMRAPGNQEGNLHESALVALGEAIGKRG